MANTAASFKQADVKRAVKGVLDAGLKVREVIATAEGVRVIPCDSDAPQGEANSWDDI